MSTLWINALLAVMAVAFIVIYLVPRLSKKGSGRRTKQGIAKNKFGRNASNDIIIPLESCLLSDVGDEKGIL